MKTKIIKLGDGCNLTVTIIDRQGMPLKLATLKSLVISLVSYRSQNLSFVANSDNTLTIPLTYASNLPKTGMYNIRAMGELFDGQAFDYTEQIIEVKDLPESTETTFITSLVLRDVHNIAEKDLPGVNYKELGYEVFSPFKAYAKDSVVLFGDTLYKFTADKSAGIWDASKVESTTVAEGGGGSAAGGNIRILFIGNSNMLDSTAYLPALMESINPAVNLTVGAAYIPQSCLGQHLAYFTGTDAEHKVTAYGYDYWVEGGAYKRQPVGGGDINTYNGYAYYKSVNGAPWSNPAPKLAAEILADVRWDVIVTQDAPDIHDWANVAPYLFTLQQYIGNNVGHAVKFGWLMTHAWTAADEATILEWWHSLATVATEVMEQTAASILLAPGTAVQNMRTIASLAALGDGIYHNLCKDDKHLQEGLGPLGAAYAVAVGILNAMGLEYQSVIGEQTRPTAAWITAQNIPGPHLGSGVIGITDDNCLLAQVAAVYAVKYPCKVINPSMSANANDRIVDEVKEFIPAPATPGTENQMLAIDANGNPVWVNPAAGSTVDQEMSDNSTNPVENRVIKSYVDNADEVINAVIEGVLYAFENGLPRLKVQELTIARKLDAYIVEGNAMLSGAGAPSILPQFNGQEYFDTTNKVWYKASFTGTEPTAAAWKPITNPTV